MPFWVGILLVCWARLSPLSFVSFDATDRNALADTIPSELGDLTSLVEFYLCTSESMNAFLGWCFACLVDSLDFSSLS
jgi:hypothetical protein